MGGQNDITDANEYLKSLKIKGKGEGSEYHSDGFDFLTFDYEEQERARTADSQMSRSSQNNIAQNMGMISLSSYELVQIARIEYPPQRLVLAAAATVVILLAAKG